jgi:hypothetical protein
MKPILAAGVLLVLPPLLRADPADPRALARRVDALLAREHQAHGIQPAPRADDAEFLRRVSLDLTGRIPRVSEVRAFLADPDPERRYHVIRALLDSPRHARHFAATWRALLTPEITANAGAGVFQAGFEAWLYQKFRTRVGYDRLVFDLLTMPIAADPKAAEVVFRDFEKPNALAFFAVKDARPENLAAVTSRLFLGVQLECAQCHNHPFASWSKKQFWNQAAFFAGIERRGAGLFQPLHEVVRQREVILPDSTRKVPAVFLDGKQPQFEPDASSRVALARWITAADNRYFARATANRLWGLLFGIGIVEPVDNFHDENPPSHPELLDELAAVFVRSGFDLDYLLTALCLTDAYQRTSGRTHPSQDDPRQFARMAVRAMMGEQFYDSLALATGYREESRPGRGRRVGGSPRAQFLAQFAPRGAVGEPETSIQQALTLMHGRFATDATTVRSSATLTAAVETPSLTTAERLDMLYLSTLSRLPTAREQEVLRRYLATADPQREPERLADVFWALLNSAEFRLNH